MIQEDNHTVTAKQNGHEIRIDTARLGDSTFSPWRADNDAKKYNIRIRKQDIHLLNALSDPPTKPRSDLINHLIYKVLSPGTEYSCKR